MKRNKWCYVLVVVLSCSFLFCDGLVWAQEDVTLDSEEEYEVVVDDMSDDNEDADTDEEIAVDESGDEFTGGSFFTIETAVGTQSVLNGKIPVYLYVKPRIDSSKTQLEWNVPRGLEAVSSTDIWFEMEEDVGRTFTLYVSPQVEGYYKIIVNVTAWRFDTNYVDSEEVEIDIDSNLIVTPQTEEYKRNSVFLTVGIIVAAAAGVVGGYCMVKLLKKKFKKWMSED